MAIFHLCVKPISRRSKGDKADHVRSVVAAAAYRSGERLHDVIIGKDHDYRNRRGVVHSEIVFPKTLPEKAHLSRTALWNLAEACEARKDSRMAKEIEIALPCELTDAERLELVKALAQYLADTYGVAVDFSIHRPSSAAGDSRNHHAHLLLTSRQVTPEGLGEKSILERSDKWLASHGMPTGHEMIQSLRVFWCRLTNAALKAAGKQCRVDYRSHLDRGLRCLPTTKIGPTATAILRKGGITTRTGMPPEHSALNADIICAKPEEVLQILSNEKAVFTRQDIVRTIKRYVRQVDDFYDALKAVMTCPALVEVQSADMKVLEHERRFTTTAMLNLEIRLAKNACEMVEATMHGVKDEYIAAAIAHQTDEIRQSILPGLRKQYLEGQFSLDAAHLLLMDAGLADEQKNAVRHITAPNRLSLVVGIAGAGKSTMLGAAKQAWEHQGLSVVGCALSGKAASGLLESSGIPSHTIKNLEYSWCNGRKKLGPHSVLVVDEAAMLSTETMAFLLAEANMAGAKVVLVGDHNQLQAINAGAPFRALAQTHGYAELTGVRRQKQQWQQQATQKLAKAQIADALQDYYQHQAISLAAGEADCHAQLVGAYIRDMEDNPLASRLMLAHRRADVKSLNHIVRQSLIAMGRLGPMPTDEGQSVVVETPEGKREVMLGEQLVCLKNEKSLGVKNGMLATVIGLEGGKLILKMNDEAFKNPVVIDPFSYSNIDYGYCITIHKSQGATTDRAFVLASASMDRHMTYVAMSRHRYSARLFADRQQFKTLTELSAALSKDGAKENISDFQSPGNIGSFEPMDEDIQSPSQSSMSFR